MSMTVEGISNNENYLELQVEKEDGLYGDNIQQLALFQKNGPLGIKVVDGKFVSRSWLETILSYSKAALSILTRSQDEDLKKTLSLAERKVRDINLTLESFSKNQNIKNSPLFFKLIHCMLSYRIIHVWNTQHGLCGGLKGTFQRMLLNASGWKWQVWHNQNYIHYSIPTPRPELPKELFNCTYVNADSLPLVISPANPQMTLQDLQKWLSCNQKTMNDLINKTGGILFRGFPIKTAGDFEKTVESALGRRTADYIGGDGARDKIADANNVYTSTKADDRFFIRLHQEKSVWPEIPQNIAFYCKSAPQLGTGQTIIGKAKSITEDMKQTPIWQRYEGKELNYYSLHPPKDSFYNLVNKTHKTWHQVFDIPEEMDLETAKKEVERICAERKITYRWIHNDTWLEVSRSAPATRPDPNHPGESVWCNQVHFSKLTYNLVGRYFDYLAAKTLYLLPNTWQSDVTFKDGSPITNEEIHQIEKILDKNQIKFDWKEGDLMILPNILTCHGRATYEEKNGHREVWVTVVP